MNSSLIVEHRKEPEKYIFLMVFQIQRVGFRFNHGHPRSIDNKELNIIVESHFNQTLCIITENSTTSWTIHLTNWIIIYQMNCKYTISHAEIWRYYFWKMIDLYHNLCTNQKNRNTCEEFSLYLSYATRMLIFLDMKKQLIRTSSVHNCIWVEKY